MNLFQESVFLNNVTISLALYILGCFRGVHFLPLNLIFNCFIFSSCDVISDVLQPTVERVADEEFKINETVM